MTSGLDGAEDDPMARARAAMGQIGQQACVSNLARLTDLDEAVAAAASGSLTDERRAAAVDIAHQVVGSAGTFGFRDVSQQARRLETLLQAAEPITAAEVASARQCLLLMREGLESGPDQADFD